MDTDTRIATLRAESTTHGDLANAIMCARALGEDLTEREQSWLDGARASDIASDRNLAAHVDGLTAETARREACAQLREIEENLAD